MRVVFAPWPTPSHLYPTVSLAWALHAAGHEVCVAAHPDFADAVTAAGLTFVSLGHQDRAPTLLGPGRPTPPDIQARLDASTEALALDPASQDLWEVFCQFMLPPIWDFLPPEAAPQDRLPAVDELVEFACRWQPDLVLWDPCIPAAAVAARVCGAAQARLMWGLDYFAWTLDRLAERAGSSPVLDWNPLAETVRPVADRYGVEVDDELLLGQWTVDPLPAGMRLPADTRTVPVRWVPFTGAAVLPEWLYERPSRPRVALSLGQSARLVLKGGWDQVPVLLDMVAELDAEVVATLNEAQLGAGRRIPDNVRAVEYLPLGQLLPTCSALIHHGGIGTFSAAVAERVPQLIIDSKTDSQITAAGDADGVAWVIPPKHLESSDTATYVVNRGAGLALDIERHTAAEMRKRVQRVLTEPSFADGATRLYEDALAAPTPTDAVPTLEKLTAQHRR